VQSLVPVGATAALSAAFNTPVSAVIFSLEEIIGDMNAPLLGSTVIASVAAVIVERSILGNDPLFRVPAYHLLHPGELLAYAVLGIIGGVASVAFCKGVLSLRLAFRRLPVWTTTWQPAIGGLAIGLLLLVVPQVAGVGYQYVDQALAGGLLLKTMAVFFVAKLAATIISYASGNAGGIFGPSLYFGAMLGGGVGVVMSRIAPFPVGEPGAYALVGMGALFAGIIRAPMTSVFMIFEITQDYQIIVPLMVANLLSLAISRRYQREPVYEALLHQDGIHLASNPGRQRTPGLQARHVVDRTSSLVAPDTPVSSALTALSPAAIGAAIGEPDLLVGVVSRERLLAELAAGRGDTRVDALVAPGWAHAHPDHPLEVVLDRLRQNPGVLPVVSREDIRRVEGVITRESIFHPPQDPSN
jgi:CIC family chloride channel protein